MKKLKIGKKYWHCMFGWCVVTHPTVYGKTLVELECDELEYYSMGHIINSKRDDKDGTHILCTPANQLFKDDKQDIGELLRLKKIALNPKLTFKWEIKP